MVLGEIANVRQLAGSVDEDEMDDDTIEEYLEKGTSYVENATKVDELDWPPLKDYPLAKQASECYAASYASLIISTQKDRTARFNELQNCARTAIETILMGVPGLDDDPNFIDQVRPYMSSEMNEGVEEYKSEF